MIPSASFVATALLLGGMAVDAASIDFRQLKRDPTFLRPRDGASLTQLRKRDSHMMDHGDGDISAFMDGVVRLSSVAPLRTHG